LEFYNDEGEAWYKPITQWLPKRSKSESEEAFQRRLQEWGKEIPHVRTDKPKGNSMTQDYYSKRLLPVYIEAVQRARVFHGRDPILQEDNDPSHNTSFSKPYGKAQTLRRDNWIVSLVHPPNSPDLNPIEAIWNILKQRVRKRTWRTLEELKSILQDEWDKITMDEVRKRIREMPERCRQLVKTGGKPIRSDIW
jgi:hypothetical protein